MKPSQPTSARRAASEQAYQDAKLLGTTVPLEQEPHLQDFDHWYLITNRFPYDMTFVQHDMLLPRSGAPNRDDLTLEEGLELNQILDYLSAHYDLYFENFAHRRSVAAIYHLHFARYHSRREDFKL